MIQAVIFDIGNVLIEWHPERFFDRMIGADRRAAFFAEVDLAGMNDRLDGGAAFTPTLAAMIAENPDWAAELGLWRDNWLQLLGPAIPHSVRLLRALKAKGVPVHALSNYGAETYALSTRQPEYGFLSEFDKVFVSGQMKVMKPDPAIYAAVEAGLGLDPATLLFTDDRADNCAAARARGWHTHLFDGPEGLAADLVAQGLLRPEEAV